MNLITVNYCLQLSLYFKVTEYFVYNMHINN
jgi:hypothetical protein